MQVKDENKTLPPKGRKEGSTDGNTSIRIVCYRDQQTIYITGEQEQQQPEGNDRLNPYKTRRR